MPQPLPRPYSKCLPPVGPLCPLKGSDGALNLGLNVAVKIGGKKDVKMMLLQWKMPMALGEVPMALDADGYI